MNFARTATSSLLILLAATAASVHADPVKSREQARAELLEDIRAGNMLAPGESGLRLNQLNPQRYPAAAPVAGKTRSEVEAELKDAVRSGNIVAGGESGLTMREMFPQRYPAAPVVAGRSRADVKAETLEAIRTGDIITGESGLRLSEQFPQHYMGARPVYAATPQFTASAARAAAQ